MYFREGKKKKDFNGNWKKKEIRQLQLPLPF